MQVATFLEAEARTILANAQGIVLLGRLEEIWRQVTVWGRFEVSWVRVIDLKVGACANNVVYQVKVIDP